jgi:hypothetical protein
MSENIQEEAARAELEINSKKTKELRLNSKITAVTNWVIKIVEQITNLGSVVTLEEGALQDVTMRVKKTNRTLVELYPLRRNKNILIKNKIRVFKSNVISVLLHRCEMWK